MTQKEVTQEQALEALERMRRNASAGVSANDYEIMNPDGYAVDMDTHFEDVETLRQYIEGQGEALRSMQEVDVEEIREELWSDWCEHSGDKDCTDVYLDHISQNYHLIRKEE